MMVSDTNRRKILLAGDISSAFLDADQIGKLSCEVHVNMLDAIEAAAKESFAIIAVVMSGTQGRLSSALQALREANPEAKIILLTQMYEEPIAMQLVSSASNGSKAVDDYLICPVRTSGLRQLITTAGRRQGFISAESAVAEAAREAKIKQLEKLATTDELTGLKNRRYIWEFSRQIIAHARKENRRVTLLIFDIDNLKHYNDVYGHLAGDEILKQSAVLMQRCCRRHDVVGRVGGDEFAAVFWDDPQTKAAQTESERRSASAEHPKEAIFIAERLRRQLRKAEFPSLGPEGKGVLTISGGLASFPYDGSTIEELFAQADKALLEAKRSGKNRIYLVGAAQGDIADIQ